MSGKGASIEKCSPYLVLKILEISLRRVFCMAAPNADARRLRDGAPLHLTDQSGVTGEEIGCRDEKKFRR